MAVVIVTPAQQQDLWLLAEGRQKGKPKRKGWGGKSPVANHYIGLLGEFAASRILEGHNLDRGLYGARGDGGMADLTGVGGGVSIKTRTKRGYDLALQSDKLTDFKADAAVLCWPGDDATQKMFCTDPKPLDVSIAVEVVGIVSYNTFAAKAHLVDYSYGMRLALSHEHLTPIKRPLWPHEAAAYIKNS